MDNHTSGNFSEPGAHYPADDVLRMVCFISVGTITLIVNALAFAAIVFYERSRENYVVLIGSLSLSDALVGLSLMLEPIMRYRDWGITIIIILSFLNFVSVITSQWHTVALSIDRWIAVHYALNYHSIMSPFRLKLLVAASWILGFTETLVLILLQVFIKNGPFVGERIISLLYVMHLAVILSINATNYSKLWSVARRQRRRIAQLQQQQDNTTGVNKATVMVMVIVAVFGLLWGPVIVTTLWYSIVGEINSRASSVYYYSLLGGYSNSLINCVVYVVFNKNFRKILTRHLKCKGCVRKG